MGKCQITTIIFNPLPCIMRKSLGLPTNSVVTLVNIYISFGQTSFHRCDSNSTKGIAPYAMTCISFPHHSMNFYLGALISTDQINCCIISYFSFNLWMIMNIVASIFDITRVRVALVSYHLYIHAQRKDGLQIRQDNVDAKHQIGRQILFSFQKVSIIQHVTLPYDLKYPTE